MDLGDHIGCQELNTEMQSKCLTLYIIALASVGLILITSLMISVTTNTQNLFTQTMFHVYLIMLIYQNKHVLKYSKTVSH